MRAFLLTAMAVPPVLGHGQVLHNADFAAGCDTCASTVHAWTLAWAGRGVQCAHDNGALRISCTDSADAVGFVEQPMHIAPVAEPVLFALSAGVRTNDLRGKGATLNIACYDASGGFLTNKDMGLYPQGWIHGTAPMARYTLKAILPASTAMVNVGLLVNGRGTVWLDDVAVERIPLQSRTADARSQAYLAAALDTIRAHALYRDSVDLDSLRTVALRIAGSGDDPADRHLAVEFLLHALGDHHSFLMAPATYTAWKNNEGAAHVPVEFATHQRIGDNGYVAVPAFMSGDPLAMDAFADSLQHALRELAHSGVKGWIVDLRRNTGGNMAPMVAGLGPLFDPGVLGGLTDVRGRTEQWSYRDGVYGWEGRATLRVPHPVQLANALPIAVLTSAQTGSSGECTALSFVGNRRTRSFGQPTWGLTTGNGEFALPDGARMFMASTRMGDRSGRPYPGPIVPDEVVEQPEDWRYDAALEAALQWLAKQ